MSVVRVLSKCIAFQGSLTTVRCLRRKLVHRWRSIMMFGRIYYSFCSGVKPHPTYVTSAINKCHRCSRRFSGSIAAAMCLRFFWEVQAICRSWWIGWVLGGVRRVVRRGNKRWVLYAESEELHQKWEWLESDARYGVGKFEGVREKGGSDEPPEPPPPPWLRAWNRLALVFFWPLIVSSFFIKHCILPPCFCIILSTCRSLSLSVVPHPIFLISGMSLRAGDVNIFFLQSTFLCNERYNELWYSPDGAAAIRVILLMRCSGRHWQPKQKQTLDAVLRTQMQ